VGVCPLCRSHTVLDSFLCNFNIAVEVTNRCGMDCGVPNGGSPGSVDVGAMDELLFTADTESLRMFEGFAFEGDAGFDLSILSECTV